ncbi:hypothetical protein [Salipiger abyssi]|uniref:hypothetical protein n=1 Tax=Salipiger abyssi TaxID=1250539 RepID=UPI004058D2C3
MAFADHPTLHPANWLRDIEAQVPRKAVRDLWNRFRYGADAPRSDERIYLPPCEIRDSYDANAGRKPLRRQHSGMIVAGDWDLCRTPFAENIKFQSCRMHYEDGVAWEDTPLFARMLRHLAEGRRPDGCVTHEDVVNRYETLDRIYEETQRRGRLLAQSELPEYFRREHGGILVHIDRNGQPLRASGGMHRLAIAQILKLPEVPAQLGVVHPEAIYKALLAPLRQSRLG